MKQNLQINTDNLAHNEKLVIRERNNGQVEISREYKLMQGGAGIYNSITIVFMLFIALVLFLAFFSPEKNQDQHLFTNTSQVEPSFQP